MNTILFAAAGVIALAGLSYLFMRIEILRKIRWSERVAKFRLFGKEPHS